jgi:hypothetical protein
VSALGWSFACGMASRAEGRLNVRTINPETVATATTVTTIDLVFIA